MERIEDYVLSKMCHDKEAAVHGMSRLSASYFTGKNQDLYTLISGLWKVSGSVDLHVLCSQFEGRGGNAGLANDVFHYSLNHSDSWVNVFSEFQETGIKRRAQADLGEIFERSRNGITSKDLASETMRKAAGWITRSEKRYHSGKEIDELPEEYGEPILTGFKIYDEEIYRNGGNRKGQVKGTLCRYKHGKTRSECWEVAQNIRMGHKVLYLTLEGIKKDVTGNVKAILMGDWEKYRENLFVHSGSRNIDDLIAIATEAILIDGVEKIVVDYLQRVQAPGNGQNEQLHNAVEPITDLAVQHNVHVSILSQTTKINQYATVPKDADGNNTMPKGWKYVPQADEAYGSQALLNAVSILFIGFRPNRHEENIVEGPLSSRVLSPNGSHDALHSFYMKIAMNRRKPDNLHRWWRFQDSDNGLQNPIWHDSV